MATMVRGMSASFSLLPNTFFELLPFLSPMPGRKGEGGRSQESGVAGVAGVAEWMGVFGSGQRSGRRSSKRLTLNFLTPLTPDFCLQSLPAVTEN
jgi:hypothetical protein